jgi:hypothetical protein
VEGANPRHGHEWKVFKEVQLPDGMILIAGVIDTKTSFIEHPELVADRIMNYASAVGRENVMAGTDCGFGTSADRDRVAPSISWAPWPKGPNWQVSGFGARKGAVRVQRSGLYRQVSGFGARKGAVRVQRSGLYRVSVDWWCHFHKIFYCLGLASSLVLCCP